VSPNKRHISKRYYLIPASFLLLLITGIIYFRLETRIATPAVPTGIDLHPGRMDHGGQFFSTTHGWFRKSRSGLFELYVQGSGFNRGISHGVLTREQMEFQEEAFLAGLRKMIPDESYLRFLKYVVKWFDRDIDEYIPEEYLQEIYGISLSASLRFDFIAPNYERILNYHAAHDIGHAMQNMNLVGCTSLVLWDENSEDSTLLIWRNFDFYVGDAFSERKIVCFIQPDSGYNHMLITWAGMIGVVSGMNEQGLTVTINAAKSDIPFSAKTPISLIAREILQYASNIQEANKIASSRKSFVSETFLIGSANDACAAIIEKTPDKTILFRPSSHLIICTNHFQSDELKNDELNLENIRNSASAYRYERVSELLQRQKTWNVHQMAQLLRDQLGKNDSSIGMGNEKAINQLIAHHSVIFMPEHRLVWVSAGPFQVGEYICYDLNRIFSNFANLSENMEISEYDVTIEPDTFLTSNDFRKYQRFRQMSEEIRKTISAEEKTMINKQLESQYIQLNPEFYLTYDLLGDYHMMQKEFLPAMHHYQLAMKKEIPTVWEKDKINGKLEKCIKKTVR